MNKEISDKIDELQTQIRKNQEEIDVLQALVQIYPDLKIHTNRWGKIRYSSKTANQHVTKYERGYNCGCCSDSPLEIWPYVETNFGKIYSDPTCFIVGERGFDSTTPIENWQESLRVANIPDMVISDISIIFNVNDEE